MPANTENTAGSGSEQLQFFRKSRDLTIDDMAGGLDVSRNTLIAWLYGHRRPSPDNVARISRYTRGAVTFVDWYK